MAGINRNAHSLEGRAIVLPVARGCPPLHLRLTRLVPYETTQVRSVTLVCEAGRLWLDVTAEVPVEVHDLDPEVVAGVDLGIIHPFAVVARDEGLVVSGRALRAEHRLHLADTKGRRRAVARRAPAPGQRGSRRWRRLRRRQRQVEGRHRRRVRQVQHEAAREVVAWALRHRVATLVVGHPKGITRNDVGHRHNLALRTWGRTHLLGALVDKAALAGIGVVLVDERGTSSTCPECHAAVSKPKGRNFACPSCGHRSHRDLVGARNIAGRAGGHTGTPVLVTHRRAGRNLPGRERRDPRRIRMEKLRGPWPAVARPGALGESLVAPFVA